MREHLPETRRSVTHKAVIYTETGRTKFYLTVGFFEDGRPGEIFITFDEAGSTLDGFADSWAIAVSMLLQSGWSLAALAEKFGYQGFEPSGRTEAPGVGLARSVVDYVVRWMAAECGGVEQDQAQDQAQGAAPGTEPEGGG